MAFALIINLAEQSALLKQSSGIILAHNHPGGDPAPSRQDKEVTQQTQKAGHVLGVRVLDHIIISRGGHYSFQENGKRTHELTTKTQEENTMQSDEVLMQSDEVLVNFMNNGDVELMHPDYPDQLVARVDSDGDITVENNAPRFVNHDFILAWLEHTLSMTLELGDIDWTPNACFLKATGWDQDWTWDDVSRSWIRE